jgi:hypothetical protein
MPPQLDNLAGQNIVTSIRGSMRQVADIKSEPRPASHRNAWPASSESAAGDMRVTFVLRMALVLRCAVTRRLRVRLAHISALLRVTVIARPGEVVDVGLLVDPNHGRSRAAILSFRRKRRPPWALR